MTSGIEGALETLDEARASIRVFYENSSDLYSTVTGDEEPEARELRNLSMQTGSAWAGSSQDYLDLSEAYNEGLYVKQAMADAYSDVLVDIFDNSITGPNVNEHPSAENLFRELEQEIYHIINQYHAAEYQTLLASREMDIDPTAAAIAQEQTEDEELEKAIELNMTEAEREDIESLLQKVNEELEKDTSDTYHLIVPAGDTT